MVKLLPVKQVDVGSNPTLSAQWLMVKWLSRIADTDVFPVRIWVSQQGYTPRLE